MGPHDIIDYTGYTECHPPGTHVHISTEDAKPNRERQGGQRIQAPDRGVDAGE